MYKYVVNEKGKFLFPPIFHNDKSNTKGAQSQFEMPRLVYEN